MKYIIQALNEPRNYWHEGHAVRGWFPHRADATEFSEVDRERKTLPAGGCWVITEQAPPAKHHFTTIKLRPVALRLSASEGEYDDLNAQALEFEAALRQWVKGQQILTDGWMVDVITDDE